jgi:hypothetical protein
MLPVGPLVSGLPPPLVLLVHEARTVRPAHASRSDARTRDAAAGAGEGGAQEGVDGVFWCT